MRVLFVSQRLPPEHVSGAPVQAIQLARALAREGVAIDFLTARSVAKQPIGAFEIEGMKAHRLDTVPELRASYAFAAASYTRAHPYDLIHGHALSATSLGALLGTKAPVLLKPSLGGPSGDLAKIKNSTLSPLLVRLLARADRYAVIEPEIGAELRAIGIANDRMFAAKNGVDLDRFGKDGPSADLGVKGPLVLFVGQWVARKGIDLLMQAWRLIERARSDVTLAIAGPGRPPVAPRVRALGVRNDVDRLMRAARVLVLPSFREGLSNVMLEAIACGLPVVARRRIAPADLESAIDPIEPTPTAMAAAVLEVLERPQRDPPQAIAKYGLDAVAREYAAVYREMAR